MKYKLNPIRNQNNYNNYKYSYNYHYRNQSCPKIKNPGKLILPKINTPYNNSRKISPNQNNYNTKIFTNNKEPQKLFINSFSVGRLPNGLTDLSYDIRENK